MSRHHVSIKNDRRWKTARAACLERDGHTCVGYGDRAGCLGSENLQADHIRRLEDAPELAFELDNLQTLCLPCHQQKEREYEASRLIRNTWVNPAYPELMELIGMENKTEAGPVF